MLDYFFELLLAGLKSKPKSIGRSASESTHLSSLGWAVRLTEASRRGGLKLDMALFEHFQCDGKLFSGSAGNERGANDLHSTPQQSLCKVYYHVASSDLWLPIVYSASKNSSGGKTVGPRVSFPLKCLPIKTRKHHISFNSGE